jgi:hypothetical protein
MMRFVLLTVLFLTGCESTQQFIHLASDYRNEYQPYSGVFDVNHYNRYSLICTNRTDMYGAELKARQIAADNKNPDYDCYDKGSDSNVRLNCTAKSSSNSSDSNRSTLSNMHRQNEHRSLKETFHQTCMAENGYELVRVCFRNCEQSIAPPKKAAS